MDVAKVELGVEVPSSFPAGRSSSLGPGPYSTTLSLVSPSVSKVSASRLSAGWAKKKKNNRVVNGMPSGDGNGGRGCTTTFINTRCRNTLLRVRNILDVRIAVAPGKFAPGIHPNAVFAEHAGSRFLIPFVVMSLHPVQGKVVLSLGFAGVGKALAPRKQPGALGAAFNLLRFLFTCVSKQGGLDHFLVVADTRGPLETRGVKRGEEICRSQDFGSPTTAA